MKHWVLVGHICANEEEHEELDDELDDLPSLEDIVAQREIMRLGRSFMLLVMVKKQRVS